MIDMASVYANKYRQNPQALQAAVLGQSPDPRLDPYTALNALKLVNESNRMTMAGQAQQPTSSPSLVAQNMAPQAGLGAMVPGAMGQMGQAPQGMPPQAPAAPAPVMQRSGGLAGLPTPEPKYAQGGIVAFKEPTEENNYSLVKTEYNDSDKYNPFAKDSESDSTDSEEGEGNASSQDKFNAYLMRQLKGLEGYEPKEMSDVEQGALYKKFMEREEKLAGPNIYKPANEDLKKREGAIAGNERYGQGLALISAAGQMLKGRNIAEGASNAAPAFAQQMAEVKRATMQEQRSIEQMKFSYADAERKERAGMHRAAQASVDSARKFQQDANKANFDKRRALADLAVKGSQANKPRAGGAGAAPKLAERLADAEEAYAKNPTAENRARLNALSSAAAKMKTTFSTSESGPVKAGTVLAPVQQRIDASVAAAMKPFALNSAYRKAQREGRAEDAKRLWEAEEKRQRAIFTKAEAAAAGGSSAKPQNTGTMTPPPPDGYLPDNG